MSVLLVLVAEVEALFAALLSLDSHGWSRMSRGGSLHGGGSVTRAFEFLLRANCRLVEAAGVEGEIRE